MTFYCIQTYANCIYYLQVRLILELENTTSVLRYLARSTGITFTRSQSWYTVNLGKIKLEQKEAQLVAWEQRANFKKVQELLVRSKMLFIVNKLSC